MSDATAGADDAVRRAEEDAELADLEREVAALLSSRSALSSRASSLRMSRDQLRAAAALTAEQRKEAEDTSDALAERRAREPHSEACARRSRLRPMPRLQEEVQQLNTSYNVSVAQLGEAARQIDELLAHGKITRDVPEPVSSSKKSALLAAGDVASASALPSLSAEGLSAFHVDSFDVGTTDAARANPAVVPTIATSVASSASSSPFAVHHRSLQSRYLGLDDTWARTLNQLFRALFGGSAAADGSVGVHAPTIAQSQTDLASRAELESVIQSTPHGKHTIARMRSMQSTVTPARGRIGAPRPTQRDQLAQLEEEPATFRTPPHGQSAAAAEEPPSSDPTGVAPSSSLSPSLHFQYTSELTRLYDSFPSSQDFWLCHNLLFLAVKSRIAEQHAIMVREDAYRTMTRQQVNETIAEAGLQAAALTRQLSALINGGEGGLSSQVGGFPALWHSLRSLQLLEVLRADLSFACARQREYLAAQTSLQSHLLSQRARHELLLALWRADLSRLHAVRDTAAEVMRELDEEARKWRDRRLAYKHMRSVHTATATMQATDRLTIDSRARFMQRACRMAQSARSSLAHADPPARAATSETDASFDVLLESAQSLSSFAPRFAALTSQARETRAERMLALASHARRTRQLLFADGGDVSCAASDSSSAGVGSLARLRAHPFARLEAAAASRVESVTADLNALTNRHQSQHAAVASGGESAPAGTAPGAISTQPALDVAARYVWTEFIQEPDVLDQRIQTIKRKIDAMNTK